MAYALQLSEAERARYRFMAESARTEERAQWTAAGIEPGAQVADIGCGPGALLAAGFATTDDVTRWAAAFERVDALVSRPWFAGGFFVAVGRKPVVSAKP
ncbi:MAG: hypothetical protein ACRDRP_23590 [Pseudonocardiaceae bacterium]